MDAKTYLEQIWNLNEKIKHLEQDAQQYRDMAYSLSVDATKEHLNPNHPTSAPFEKCIEKADLMERTVAELKEALAEMKADAVEKIMQLDNANQTFVLIMRYTEFWKWDEISEHIGCSENHVYKIRREALENFSKIFENDSMRIGCG